MGIVMSVFSQSLATTQSSHILYLPWKWSFQVFKPPHTNQSFNEKCSLEEKSRRKLWKAEEHTHFLYKQAPEEGNHWHWSSLKWWVGTVLWLDNSSDYKRQRWVLRTYYALPLEEQKCSLPNKKIVSVSHMAWSARMLPEQVMKMRYFATFPGILQSRLCLKHWLLQCHCPWFCFPEI